MAYSGEVFFCQCGRWKYDVVENGDGATSLATCDLCSRTRNDDGTIKLRNKNITETSNDFLYHIGIGNSAHDLVEMFGDVKFVCMGGSAHRMKNFATFIMKEINYKLPAGTQLHDISFNAHRYSMYKIGPVISVNHGMGFPSLTILLHEMIKLMYFAKCKDPIFIRLGSSGGIGIPPGTVVISNGGLDSQLRDFYETPSVGKILRRPVRADQKIVEELQQLKSESLGFEVVVGKTLATADFYEEQGRLDGAFCEIAESEKMEYLRKLKNAGVKNIEMESVAFFAYTHHAGIKSSDVCVTIIDRLQGDQIRTPKEKLAEFECYPQRLIAKFIRKHLGIN